MPLQKQFRGLSDFVGRYQGGQLTLELLQQLQPMLDISQFVEPPRWNIEDRTVTAVNQFHSAADVIPENEIWAVSQLSCVSNNPLTTGNSLNMTPLAQTPGQIERVCFDNRNSANLDLTPAVHVFSKSVIFETPQLYTGGWWFGFLSTYFTGTSEALQIGIRYQLLRA